MTILLHLLKYWQAYSIGLLFAAIVGMVGTAVYKYDKAIDRVITVEADNKLLRSSFDAQATTINAQEAAIQEWKAQRDEDRAQLDRLARSDATARSDRRRLELLLAERPIASLSGIDLSAFVGSALDERLRLLECASARGSDCLTADRATTGEDIVTQP